MIIALQKEQGKKPTLNIGLRPTHSVKETFSFKYQQITHTREETKNNIRTKGLDLNY